MLDGHLLSRRHVKKHWKPDSSMSILMNRTRLTVVGMTISRTPSSDFLINRSSDSTMGDADCTICSSTSGSGSAGGDVGLGERDNIEIRGVGALMLGRTKWRVKADIEVVLPS